MGKDQSGQEESFEGNLLEYPHYTRPREWGGLTIPEVLLSGNHAAIERWRREEATRIRAALAARTGDVGLAEAAYHIPAGGHPDMAPLDVLSNILGQGPSSRLYKGLVETKKASDVKAYVFPGHDPGLFEVEAEVRRDDSLEQARDILLATTEAVGEEDVELAVVVVVEDGDAPFHGFGRVVFRALVAVEFEIDRLEGETDRAIGRCLRFGLIGCVTLRLCDGKRSAC